MKCKHCGNVESMHFFDIYCMSKKNRRFMTKTEKFEAEDEFGGIATKSKEFFPAVTIGKQQESCGKMFHFNHERLGWLHLECGKWMDIKDNYRVMEICPSCQYQSPQARKSDKLDVELSPIEKLEGTQTLSDEICNSLMSNEGDMEVVALDGHTWIPTDKFKTFIMKLKEKGIVRYKKYRELHKLLGPKLT